MTTIQPQKDDVKSAFVPFTESDVEAFAGSGAFSRGLKYYRDSFIIDPILRGETLHAQCHGSHSGPYTLAITLVRTSAGSAEAASAAPMPIGTQRTAGLSSFQCNCEAGGFCKHLVALALTWLHKSQTVEVRPAFASLLERHSREQLLALCLKMLERQPDLDYLIQTVVPIPPLSSVAPSDPSVSGPAGENSVPSDAGSSGQTVSPLANTTTVDVASIRRRVQKVFRSVGYDYDNYGLASQLASDLQPLLQMADDYAQAGQWANAQAVYAILALEAIENYEAIEDEGDLSDVIASCADGLAQCLDVQTALPESARLSANQRHELIETLYQVWEEDRSMGGVGLSDGVVEAIANNATEPEGADVEKWLRKDMRPVDDFSSQFNNRARVNFLVALKVHSGISDEEKLEEYARFGLFADMTTLLLQMGRVEEARQLALEKTPKANQLTAFATQMIGSSLPPAEALENANEADKSEQAQTTVEANSANVDQAIAFVEERLAEADSTSNTADSATYLAWLATTYAAHNRFAQALAIELRRFEAAPSQQRYESVKKVAQNPAFAADIWTQRRPDLISRLESGGHWQALVNIYVAENEARAALDALSQVDLLETRTWFNDNLHSSVARIAETDYPDEARVLYQLMAENVIERRGRANYQVAASYLARANDLSARLERSAEFKRYVAGLQDRNKALRALKEELQARHLL